MNAPAPRAHFDRSKIFYPLVMQYVVSLIGFKELAGFGAFKLVQVASQTRGVTVEEVLRDAPGVVDRLPGIVREVRESFELMPPLTLTSVVDSPLPVDAEMIAHDLAENHSYVLRSWSQAAGVLLIAARARCQDRGYATQDPIWEFLRHCRNAAAHGNRFTMRNGEPRRRAEWRGLVLDSSVDGRMLFQEEQPGVALLKPADPVLLLWDLEQAYQLGA